MSTTLPPAVASPTSVAVGRPIERAQAVWQAAVELAGGPASAGSGVALELLRTAGFDPSTLRHALTLGDTRLRGRPDDTRLRSGRQLLREATDWLGVPPADGEVGAAGADGRRRPGVAPEIDRPGRAPIRATTAGPATARSRSAAGGNP